MIAAVISAQRDFAQFRLASCNAILRPLDAMRHRIANQMNERIGNLLNDVVVEFRLAAGKIKIDQFGRRFRGIAHRAGKP